MKYPEDFKVIKEATKEVVEESAEYLRDEYEQTKKAGRKVGEGK